MYKSFSMNLAGRTLTVDIGRVAKQANGAAFMHYGDTVVLSTATASDKPREGIDFFPLSVEYEEKLYSVGKIPGGSEELQWQTPLLPEISPMPVPLPQKKYFPQHWKRS